jgi:hypothetical protein
MNKYYHKNLTICCIISFYLVPIQVNPVGQIPKNNIIFSRCQSCTPRFTPPPVHVRLVKTKWYWDKLSTSAFFYQYHSTDVSHALIITMLYNLTN